jgi:hypothetical protein
MFTNVLKKFFTSTSPCENNRATNMEIAMKDAMKSLLTRTPAGAVEDLVGLAALFVIMFAVLSLPGFA